MPDVVHLIREKRYSDGQLQDEFPKRSSCDHRLTRVEIISEKFDMIITGEIKCESCQREIKWFYHNPNRLSSGQIDVEVYPMDRVGLYNKPHKIKENEYSMACYCRHCGRLNNFDYTSEIELH